MESCASTEETIRRPKMRIITIGLNRDLSEIKLKRTDTTLDLSQKAKRAKEERKEKIQKEWRVGRNYIVCVLGRCGPWWQNLGGWKLLDVGGRVARACARGSRSGLASNRGWGRDGSRRDEAGQPDQGQVTTSDEAAPVGSSS